MSTNYLKDSTGNDSSKRLFGTIGMILFFASSIGSAFYSIYTGNPIGAEAAGLIKAIGYTSGTLLGIGVVEKLGGKK